MFVTVENRLWHTSGASGAFTQWEKVSDIAIGSAPDCAVGSIPSGSANEVVVIALTQQGTVLIVRGNTGAFSVEDLGVY